MYSRVKLILPFFCIKIYIHNQMNFKNTNKQIHKVNFKNCLIFLLLHLRFIYLFNTYLYSTIATNKKH